MYSFEHEPRWSWKPRFAISGLHVLLWLGSVAITLGAHVALGFDSTYRAGFPVVRLTGMALALLMIPLLVSWIAFRLSRRSQRAASGTFLVVLFLATLVQLSQALGEYRPSATARASTTQLPGEATVDPKQTFAGSKPTNVSSRSLPAEQTLVPDPAASRESALIREVAEAIRQRLEHSRQVYQRALRQLNEAKVLDAPSLRLRAQIDARRQVVRNMMRANQEVRQIRVGAEAFAREQLTSRGVSRSAIAAFMDGYRQSSARQMPLILRCHDTDEEVGQAMLGILDLLDAQWGKWSYTGRDRSLLFRSKEAGAQYNQWTARIRQLAREQEELKKKVQEMQ